MQRSDLTVHSTTTRVLLGPDCPLEQGAQALREIFPEFPRLGHGQNGYGVSAALFHSLTLHPPPESGCLLVWDSWQLTLQQHGEDPVLLYEVPMVSRHYWDFPRETQRRAALTYWTRAHLRGHTHPVGAPNLKLNDLAEPGGLSVDLVYPAGQAPPAFPVAVYKGRRDGGVVLVSHVGEVNRAFFMPG